MQMAVMGLLAVAAVLVGTLYSIIDERREDAKAGRIASWIEAVTEAYVRKIVDEESEDGYNFEGLADTAGATLNLNGADLINNLLSDGTSGDPNHPACSDGAGVYGLSKRGYLRCDFPNYIPFAGTQTYSATFTRTAPATPPPHYTTGYSGISGTLTFGSAPGAPFSMDNIRENPDLAYKIWQKLSARNPDNTSNLLLASTTFYQITRDDTIQAVIDLTQNNEIAIRSDGAIPFNRDQSMGDNSLLDVKSLIWSPVNSSELMENGSIALGGDNTGTDASTIYFDKDDMTDNYMRLSTDGIDIVTDNLDVSSNLDVGGDITMDGDFIITGSGANIKKTPQTIATVRNGGRVDFPDCIDPNARRLIPMTVANIPHTSYTKPLAGFYPRVNTYASYWTVEQMNITEDGTAVPTNPDSKIGVITYCEE